LHAVDAEAPCGLGADQQRRARQVRADEDAIGMRQVEAHLPVPHPPRGFAHRPGSSAEQTREPVSFGRACSACKVSRGP
jgi:hypothetical protein